MLPSISLGEQTWRQDSPPTDPRQTDLSRQPRPSPGRLDPETASGPRRAPKSGCMRRSRRELTLKPVLRTPGALSFVGFCPLPVPVSTAHAGPWTVSCRGPPVAFGLRVLSRRELLLPDGKGFPYLASELCV